MAIPARTVAQLVNEGISTVDDLSEFSDTDFKQIAYNIRALEHPDIPDPNNANVMIPQPPFVLGAKSLKRLKVAAKAVRYYQAIDRAITPSMMRYDTVLKTFELEWEALILRKDEDEPDVPKITKNMKITRWSEAFSDFLRRIIGVRNCPLFYVIREHDLVPAAAPALANGKPYSDEHESVEGELIARLSHNHPVFKDDNAKVYQYLEQATRSTSYAVSLKKFQRKQDGRGAYLAIISQHAGVDKWDKELKTSEAFMHNRIWKGNNNFSLEKFLEGHRAAYTSMTQCAEHVTYQLPNERTRVGYLLQNIQSNDAELLTMLAQVRHDDGPDGRRSDFEKAAAALIPACPVARRRKSMNDKRPYGDIGSVTFAEGIKDGIGSTGVELRYYSEAEYSKLTPEQKKELRDYRKDQRGGGKGKKKTKKRKSDADNDGDKISAKKMKGMIASAFAEEREKAAKAAKEKEDQDNEIMSLIAEFQESNKVTSNVSAVDADAAAKKEAAMTRLRQIWKRKNKSGDQE